MSNIVPYQPPAAAVPSMALVPSSMTEAMRLADMMATARLVPVHLQKSPADCLMVIQQAVRWQMDPFAVAQATSVIQGKLMYEGKLVAAVVNARGNLVGRLGYEYSGEGDNRTVTVSGTLTGEAEPRVVSVRLKDARTSNKVWQTQPDQQLAYHAARVWARRYMPELMLGVYAPEEFDPAPAPPVMKDVTPPAEEPPPAPPKTKPPIEVRMPDASLNQFFQRNRAGLIAALDFIGDAGTQVILLNAELLTMVAERLPELADRVQEIRAAAQMELDGMDGAEPDEPDPEPPYADRERSAAGQGDDTARRMAERRGAAPTATTAELDEALG